MVAEYARPIVDEIDGLRGFERPAPSWRRLGCGDDCTLMRVAELGTLRRIDVVLHDPVAHEVYGRASANLAIRTAGLVCRTGPLVIDHGALTVTLNGRPLRVTRRETQILLYLSSRVGRACTYTNLAKAIWEEDDAFRGAHTLRVNMCRIRQKLGACADLIETVTGVGFRLKAVP